MTFRFDFNTGPVQRMADVFGVSGEAYVLFWAAVPVALCLIWVIVYFGRQSRVKARRRRNRLRPRRISLDV